MTVIQCSSLDTDQLTWESKALEECGPSSAQVLAHGIPPSTPAGYAKCTAAVAPAAAVMVASAAKGAGQPGHGSACAPHHASAKAASCAPAPLANTVALSARADGSAAPSSPSQFLPARTEQNWLLCRHATSSTIRMCTLKHQGRGTDGEWHVRISIQEHKRQGTWGVCQQQTRRMLCSHSRACCRHVCHSRRWRGLDRALQGYLAVQQRSLGAARRLRHCRACKAPGALCCLHMCSTTGRARVANSTRMRYKHLKCCSN